MFPLAIVLYGEGTKGVRRSWRVRVRGTQRGRNSLPSTQYYGQTHQHTLGFTADNLTI